MPQYGTPLRYPGGKQKLAPFFAEVLQTNGLLGGQFAELYCGGAGAAIELLLTNRVQSIFLNDSNPGVIAFWRAVLVETEKLCRLIASVPLTIDMWTQQREIIRAPHDYTEFELGFAFFYLNRCNRSGVIKGGVIGGLNQQGEWKMDARFPRNELIRRIEAIALLASSITLHNLDAEDYVEKVIPHLPANTLVYCDPPYYAKASGLYTNFYKRDDHERLSQVIQTRICRPWILSYDAAPNILQYYRQRQQFVYGLQYNAAKAYKGSEVFIISDQLKFPARSSLSYIQAAISKADNDYPAEPIQTVMKSFLD